jgi:hypothetical protein
MQILNLFSFKEINELTTLFKKNFVLVCIRQVKGY